MCINKNKNYRNIYFSVEERWEQEDKNSPGDPLKLDMIPELDSWKSSTQINRQKILN